MSNINIPCTLSEYQMEQEALSSLRATLGKALVAPVGSKLHRGIAYFQQGIARHEAFLASHTPVDGFVPDGRPYVESGDDFNYSIRA